MGRVVAIVQIELCRLLNDKRLQFFVAGRSASRKYYFLLNTGA